MPDAETTLPRFPLKQLAIIIALLGLVAAIIGIGVRQMDAAGGTDHSGEASLPAVSVVTPFRENTPHMLTLPATLQAFNSAPIYARTNGYVRRWLVDIGDSVRNGQVLALIDTPDVDQQLKQAQADYETAHANRALAQITAERWAIMLKRDAVAQQDADEKSGDFRAKDAAANAARANVRRLQVQEDFAQVRAPFAGIITSRSTQIGALIVAGTAASQPLFTVSDIHRLRAYINVPQATAPQIYTGQHARLLLPEYPGRIFDAVVTRSAGAVDPQSGSVLVELMADNRDHALKPGAYAQTQFALGGNGQGALHIPSRSIIFRGNGLSVAVVDAQGKAHLRPVTIGTDDGKTVVVNTGLTGNEHVIDTPPDGLSDGDSVRVVATTK